jgi:hypothetical protein
LKYFLYQNKCVDFKSGWCHSGNRERFWDIQDGRQEGFWHIKIISASRQVKDNDSVYTCICWLNESLCALSIIRFLQKFLQKTIVIVMFCFLLSSSTSPSTFKKLCSIRRVIYHNATWWVVSGTSDLELKNNFFRIALPEQ